MVREQLPPLSPTANPEVMEDDMIHDAPLLLVTTLTHSPIRRNRPKGTWDRASSTSVRNRGNASSRPAAARNQRAFRYEDSHARA